jgi:hypothetical protein
LRAAGFDFEACAPGCGEVEDGRTVELDRVTRGDGARALISGAC